jgi:circadian clock protein KaiC
MAERKVSSGIIGVDNVLKGGYLQQRLTLLKGGPGTGKTIFSLFFAHAEIKAGSPVVYVSFEESPEQLINHMEQFGLEGKRWVKEGKLKILDFTMQPDDEVVGEFDLAAILLRIEQAGSEIKANTLIIDSLQSLILSFPNYNPNKELVALFQWAMEENLTTLTTMADVKTIFNSSLYEEYLVDCFIHLAQTVTNKLMTRYLRVVKYRGSGHGTNEYPYTINSEGISLIPITETRLKSTSSKEYLSSGIKELDHMLGGKGL